MVTDTKPNERCCSKCGEIKNEDKFIKKRNICKVCRNKKSKEKYTQLIVNEIEKECQKCKVTKTSSSFIKSRNLCKDCNNEKRRIKYQTDEEYRLKMIKAASESKHEKVLQRKKIKLEEIGEGNKNCNYCYQIKSIEDFRHNRLKCKICERDDPDEKFKRYIRTRIYICLKNKTKHTIEYLGCNYDEYLQWILFDNDKFTLENYGKEWHIDHVLPISKFNIDNSEEQLIAFNWRNTTPLSVKDNLSKNNKILQPQIEQHYKKLIKYHKKNNIEMPQDFVCLFAKHLVAGNPLESSLPLTLGNICEELG